VDLLRSGPTIKASRCPVTTADASARPYYGSYGRSVVIGPALTPICRLASPRFRRKRTILPQDRTPGFRLAMWFFGLLASMAVGGIIWLSGDAPSIFFGTIVGGLIFTSVYLWLKGFD
jgi:hypothetical protein